MEKRLWYALQRDMEDDWGTGTFDEDEAIVMLYRNDEYNLIAVIDGDVCIRKIFK